MDGTTDHSQGTVGIAIYCLVLERVVVLLKQIMSLFAVLSGRRQYLLLAVAGGGGIVGKDVLPVGISAAVVLGMVTKTGFWRVLVVQEARRDLEGFQKLT
jgi:hypothetical protein